MLKKLNIPAFPVSKIKEAAATAYMALHPTNNKKKTIDIIHIDSISNQISKKVTEHKKIWDTLRMLEKNCI